MMKPRFLRICLAFCLVLVLLFSLAACTKPGAESPAPTSSPEASHSPAVSAEPAAENGIQPGTVFKWVSNMDMPSYLPWIDNRASLLTFQLYDNLLYKYHSDSDDIRGNLAEDWTVSDDGLVWVFQIKKDARFTSGNPVNAEAFVKSWDAAKVYQPRYFAPVKSYEATGEYELTVTLNGPSATFIYDLPLQPQCGVVDPEALAEFGPEDNRSAVGCGPYYVESYSSGEKFVLKANPDYHNPDKAPSIETCEIVIIPDENTALIALMNGELDGMKTVNIEVYNNLAENGWDIASIPFLVNPYWLNAREVALFRDPVVREALCHMIDWQAVSDLVYDGLFPTTDSYWVGPGAYPYDDRYSYDPDKGIKMLEDAGYSKDDIAFTILGDPDLANMNTAVMAQFNELGFENITCETYDGSTCYGMLLAGTYQMWPCHNGYSWESPLTPYSMGLLPDGTQRCMWLEYMDEAASQEALEHYQAALDAPDFDSYVQEVAEITRICQEQCAAIGGLQSMNFYAVNPRFDGVYVNALGGYIEFFSLRDTQA